MNPAYDDFFQSRFNTALSPEEEQQFQAWAKSKGKNPDNESIDYDLRGFWKSGDALAPNGHATDTYKKPNHPTFSNESIYHGTPTPSGGVYVGGTWTSPDEISERRGAFTPSQEMLDTTHPTDMLKKYFKKNEPEYDLLLPKPNKSGGAVKMPDDYSSGNWKLI